MYTEDDFADPDIASPYTRSKILSEKAAWRFVAERKAENQSCFELVVLNPGLITGPVFHDTFCASMEVAKRLMCGELWMLPDLCLPSCDARDVALAHIRALSSAEVVDKRHLLLNSATPHTFKEVAEYLGAEFSSRGYSIRRVVAPDFFIYLASFFDSSAKFVLGMLGKRPRFDTARLSQVFGIQAFDVRQSFIEMSYSMIEKGFIPKK